MSINEWAFGKSSNDITNDYEERIRNALTGYNNAWADNNAILTGAMKRGDGSNRSIGTSLDDYDKKQRKIMQGLDDQQDASLTYGNQQMNTFQHELRPTLQNVAGSTSASRVFGTGDSLNRAMNNANANQWNNALAQGSAIGALNTSALGSQANMAEQQLTNDAMPQQDALAMMNDWNTTNLQTATQMATNRAKTEMNDRGLIGNIANIVK